MQPAEALARSHSANVASKLAPDTAPLVVGGGALSHRSAEDKSLSAAQHGLGPERARPFAFAGRLLASRVSLHVPPLVARRARAVYKRYRLAGCLCGVACILRGSRLGARRDEPGDATARPSARGRFARRRARCVDSQPSEQSALQLRLEFMWRRPSGRYLGGVQGELTRVGRFSG